ncbi:MAG: DUF481 domain-containing protein [Kofleriaceae bacterium]|nr:DUF481 domain-containing protein [Myxococcales bacterium]MCB9559022.1 DUF481 domain-containing protein [Kofleriaceae bacterium]MCB9574700.1 DUF481 domain-containing protein [Kofleriaceae bacterium]
MSCRLLPAAVIGIALVLIAAPRPAAAQIVNVQGVLAGDPEPGWSGQVTVTADWRTGNTDLALIGGSVTTLYRHDRWLGLGIVRGEYAEATGARLSEKTFEHLRGRVELDRRWMWEAFGQHEYDAFRRLSVRALAGTGPAVRLVRGERARLIAGLAYMLEYEALDDRMGVADAGETSIEHRLSSYLTGSYKVDAKIAVTQTVYVQPRIDDPADLRLLSETALTSKLSSWLAVTTSLIVARDASPPDGIEPLDSALKVQLGVTF